MATEKRLIDADAFIEHYCECCGQCCDLENCCCQTVTDILDFQTEDAVEVIRCKDCKHWYEQEGVCLKIYSDGAVSPYAWQYRNSDDFCSCGERKDNE